MQNFPHYYHAQAMGQPTGTLATHSGELTTLDIAAPKEFNGPGDKWSPEELLVASVADCLILTFRAVANASKLEWSELSCKAKGTLEMVERKTQFTEIHIDASLKINSADDEEKALQLLEKAENSCLITNSLKAKTHLKANVNISS
jgi:peroxiredoxin-like protein